MSVLEDMGLTDNLSRKRPPLPLISPEVQFDDHSIPYSKLRTGGQISPEDFAPDTFNPDHFDVNTDVSLASFIKQGWFAVDDTWTRASNTTITVPSDATNSYAIGMKLRMTDSATTKYFYTTGVSATLLTVTGGINYAVSGALSNIYYSLDNAFGFPYWFDWTPAFECSGAMTIESTTINKAQFMIYGPTLYFYLDFTGTLGAVGASDIRATLPVVPINTNFAGGGEVFEDNASRVGYWGISSLSGTGQIYIRHRDSAQDWATGGTSAHCVVQGFYRIA